MLTAGTIAANILINFKNLSELSERDYLKTECFKTNRYFSDNKCKYEYLWRFFLRKGWSITWYLALAGRKIDLPEDKRGLNIVQMCHSSSLSIFVWRTVVLRINTIIHEGTRRWSTKKKENANSAYLLKYKYMCHNSGISSYPLLTKRNMTIISFFGLPGQSKAFMTLSRHLRTFARKTYTIQIFFVLWLQSDNELPMSEMEKNWGVTDFVFEIKRVKNYPDFDKSALVTRHGLSAC